MNMQPCAPFRIKFPKNFNSNPHSLSGDKIPKVSSTNSAASADADSDKEKLLVEPYIPPDPGPYPQDQPKQNSVRFTPTQVLGYFHCYDLFC